MGDRGGNQKDRAGRRRSSGDPEQMGSQNTRGPYDVTGSGGESGPLGSQPQAQAPSSTSFSTKTQPRQDAGLGSSGVSWRHLWDAPLLAATVRWTTRTIGPGNPPDGTGLDARVRRRPNGKLQSREESGRGRCLLGKATPSGEQRGSLRQTPNGPARAQTPTPRGGRKGRSGALPAPLTG